MIRRFAKFYVNYWAIFVIFVPFGVFLMGRSLEEAYGVGNVVHGFFLDVLGLGGASSYNATWWFNELIIYLYILFPFVFIAAKQYPLITLIGFASIRILRILSEANVWIMWNIPIVSGIYMMPFVLGMLWAIYSNEINKYFNEMRLSHASLIIAAVLMVFALVIARQKMFLRVPSQDWDTLLSVALVILVLVSKPYIFKSDYILAFLGKHSMNIYMTHTFVFFYFWQEEIYRLNNPWLILIVVMLITLLFSVVLEWIKEKIKLNKLYEWIR